MASVDFFLVCGTTIILSQAGAMFISVPNILPNRVQYKCTIDAYVQRQWCHDEVLVCVRESVEASFDESVIDHILSWCHSFLERKKRKTPLKNRRSK